jgi:hypothetical protein
MKIYELDQTLLHAEMDKQTTWRIFINFTFLFKESGQKNLLIGCSDSSAGRLWKAFENQNKLL